MTMLAEKKWLACRIDKGMFNDELAVTYPATGEIVASVFVPKTDAEGDLGKQGKVRVLVIRDNGQLFALLPSSEQEVIAIREADVLP